MKRLMQMAMAVKHLFLLVFLMAFTARLVSAQQIYSSPPPPVLPCKECNAPPLLPATPPPPSIPKIYPPPPAADTYSYGSPPAMQTPPNFPYYPYYNTNHSPPLFNASTSCSFLFLMVVLPLLHFLLFMQ
ncbi:hypothetical protein SUGI_0110830 [Cryptomeria japonica]|nr:hypothetical protein SUGI_0110830 [Cryptomeria japonica]